MADEPKGEHDDPRFVQNLLYFIPILLTILVFV